MRRRNGTYASSAMSMPGMAHDADEAAAGGVIRRANDEPMTSPCGTRVVAAIVALLVLAWAVSRYRTAARSADATTRR
jgi:hypothetical protein